MIRYDRRLWERPPISPSGRAALHLLSDEPGRRRETCLLPAAGQAASLRRCSQPWRHPGNAACRALEDRIAPAQLWYSRHGGIDPAWQRDAREVAFATLAVQGSRQCRESRCYDTTRSDRSTQARHVPSDRALVLLESRHARFHRGAACHARLRAHKAMEALAGLGLNFRS